MNRRQFISKSAAALTLAGIAGQDAMASISAKPNRGRIGLVLYSVRNELPKDFEGTLKKVSAMGYSAAELFKINDGDFFGHPLKEVRVMLKDLGMSITGTHTGSGVLPEDINAPEWDFWKKISEYVRTVDAKWAIQAGFPGAKSVDDLKRLSAHFNRVGQVCQKNGVKFAYHNHHAELGKIEGEVILEYLIKNTDPKYVFFQMDMGHTVNGGGDCTRYLREFPKRIPLWHASDFDAANRKYTWLGKGSVPYPALFDLAKSSGLEVLNVEQETLENTLEACKSDFNYLKQFKWTKA